MIEVELPNGQIIEFPEGTDSETMKRVARQAMQASPPADTTQQTAGNFAQEPVAQLTSPEEPSTLGQFVGGAVRGVTGVGRLAAAADRWIYDKLGMEQPEQMLLEGGADVAESLVQPEHKDYWLTNRLGEFAPAVMAGPAGLAGQALKKGVTGVGKQALKSAAARTAGDVAAVGTSVAGANIGEAIGGTPGAIVGGVAGAMVPSGAVRTARRAMARNTPNLNKHKSAMIQDNPAMRDLPERELNKAASRSVMAADEGIPSAGTYDAATNPNVVKLNNGRQVTLTPGLVGNELTSRVQQGVGDTLIGSAAMRARSLGGDNMQRFFDDYNRVGNKAINQMRDRAPNKASLYAPESPSQTATNVAAKAAGNAEKRVRGALDQVEKSIGTKVDIPMSPIRAGWGRIKDKRIKARYSDFVNELNLIETQTGRAKGNTSYQRLKQLRTDFNNKLEPSHAKAMSPFTRAIDAQMKAAARRAGVADDWVAANKQFASATNKDLAAGKKGELKSLRALMKGEGENAVLNKLRANAYKGDVAKMVAKEAGDDWPVMAAAAVDDMMSVNPGQQGTKAARSPDKFATAWSKLDDVEKNLYSGNNAETREILDALAVLGKSSQELIKSANNSGTARTSHIINILNGRIGEASAYAGAGALGGIPAVTLTAATQALAARGISSRHIANWLAGSKRSLNEIRSILQRRMSVTAPLAAQSANEEWE